MKEEKEDFFDQIPEEKPKPEKKPKEPKLRPDDPLYYEREEGKWEHLTPGPFRRNLWIWGAIGVIGFIILFIWIYVYFFTPAISEAEEFGYVEQVQREGKLFQTYEGVILPYKNLKDASRRYDGDFIFSTDDASAAKLRVRQRSGLPVRVEYKVYRTRMPWRGASKTIVTAVDTTEDVRKVLPPELRPEHP